MNRSLAIIGFLSATASTLFVLQWDIEYMRIFLWSIVLMSVLIGSISSLLFKKRTVGWTFVAIGIGVSIAVLRIDNIEPVLEGVPLSTLPEGTRVELVGWVREAPEFRPTSTRYVINVHLMKSEDGELLVSGNILVTDRATWPEYKIGQYVSIAGSIMEPKSFEGFDYAKYLSAKGIDRTMDRARIQSAITTVGMPWSIRFSPSRVLHPLRRWFEYRITRVLPEPHASLLIGLLTGGRTGMPETLSDQFRIAGLSHIVAISGYNITIILTLCSSLLFFLPLKKRFWPLAVGISLFVIFVGAGAPVVRAGIMGILGLIAIQADRIARPRLLILWTLFCMSLWNPKELWYDPGFQLSFLATLGIAELGPFLKRAFRFVPENYGIRESLATTIAAEIATLPVAMLLFRQVSLIAPISNLLVAPLIPISMFTGFLATIIGAVVQPLGLMIGVLPWFLLSLILNIAEIAASLPLAALHF